ncbi:MAG: hypothetical protein AAFN77_16930 [Planctomycetota bacterium]
MNIHSTTNSILDTLAAENESESFDLELALDQIAEDPAMRQLILRNADNEGETMTVYQRLQWMKDQQTVVVHLPLTPSFTKPPSIEGVLDDEPEARVRVTDCQVYGVRIEVILDHKPTTSISRILRLNLHAPSPKQH